MPGNAGKAALLTALEREADRFGFAGDDEGKSGG
jgi:hypothetical protein